MRHAVRALKNPSNLSTEVTVKAGPKNFFNVRWGPGRLGIDGSALQPAKQDTRASTYISPKRPGLFLSREISAYIVTLGRSTVNKISFIAAGPETQICLGPNLTTFPYFECLFSTYLQIVPRANMYLRWSDVNAAYHGPGISRRPDFRADDNKPRTRRVDSTKTTNSWTATVIAPYNGRTGSRVGEKVDATLKRLVDDR
jgi:hypothetical protein